jgi:hypothetical protein
LLIKQRATGRPAMRQGRNDWAIQLNDNLPTDLKVRVGAGQATLVLGGLSLTRLHVEGGVGAATLDLSGAWKQNLDAYIKSGIGSLTLRLPTSVGVRVETQVGLGDTQQHGLTWNGDAHINALYGHSPVALDILVEGGIGAIKLEQAM